MRIFMLLILACVMLAGCSQADVKNIGRYNTFQTHNPTAEEILQNNPDADIFLLNGIVYTNASDIEWVQAKEITADEKIGTIVKQSIDGSVFTNEMATKLPVGTEIFKPLNSYGIIIVKLGDEEIRYLGLIEG